MGVSIKSVEAERKLRRISRLLGKSMTATVIELADGKLKELEAKKEFDRRMKEIELAVKRIKSMPVLSAATADEILGYNDKGHFD